MKITINQTLTYASMHLCICLFLKTEIHAFQASLKCLHTTDNLELSFFLIAPPECWNHSHGKQ